MNADEKAKTIAERLSTEKGRRRLAENMREPLSYGFRVPYADHEFLCDCCKVVKPTGFGLCPECGFDLMLSKPIPPLVIVIEAEIGGSIPCSAVYSWKPGTAWGADDDCVTIVEEW